MFTRLSPIGSFALLAIACAGFNGALAHEPGEHADKSHSAQTLAAPLLSFGEELPSTAAIPLAQALTAAPSASGKQIISGRIGKVCQNKGCWMTLHDGDAMVRVETAHRFVIPADAKGDAEVLGTFKRSVLDEDRAAHLRSESLDVVAGESWTIDAMGVRILE